MRHLAVGPHKVLVALRQAQGLRRLVRALALRREALALALGTQVAFHRQALAPQPQAELQSSSVSDHALLTCKEA